MSKTWHFIKNSSIKKESLLLQQEDTKGIKTKITGLPPVKHFLYSHIARLTYLTIKMGEAHEGTCTSACPSFLGSVPYIIPGSHGVFMLIKIMVKLKHGKKLHKI
jgi:predicted membrane channel-forming protein YqfA (hemolysin III family)